MSLSTVSATVSDPSGQIFANGSWQLIFKSTPNTPGLFTDGGVAFTKLFGGTLDNAGSFSQAGVARNDTIAPAGSKWTLIVAPNASSQAFSIDLNINNAAFSASALINAVITNITVPATSLALAYKDAELIPAPKDGSVYFDNTLNVLKVYDAVNGVWLTVGPTAFNLNPTFSSLIVTPGLSSVQALTAAGNVIQTAGQNQYNAFKINNMLFVDNNKYTTIQSALNDLPSGGGIVFVCPNDVTGRYLETLTANLIINKSNVVIQFLCPAVISTGAFRVTIASGLTNISILSTFAHSSNQAGSNLGVSFVPTTATPVFDIGDSSGFVFNFYIRGINVGLGGGATVNARGFRFTNVVQFGVEYCQTVMDNAAGQVGIEMLGTGGALFSGLGNLIGFEAVGGASASSCIGVSVAANCNGVTIVGGHATLATGLNTIAINVAGNGVTCLGFDADTCNLALNVTSTTNGAFNGKMRIDSGTTNIATFGVGSNGNVLEVINGRPLTTVIDNGTAQTNSVYNGFDWQINTRRFRMTSETSFTGFQISDQSDGSLAFGKSVGNLAQVNSSNGSPIRLNPNTGDGVEFWNRNTTAAVLIVDVNGTIHPAVAGAVGAGTTALPFLEFRGKRYYSKGGTAFSGADAAIVLSAGWGTTRTVSAASGFDQAFQFTVNATGTGQAASPTITITFKDGTWTSAPVVDVSRNDNSLPTTSTFFPVWTVTATGITITMNGTPTAGVSYIFTVMCWGT